MIKHIKNFSICVFVLLIWLDIKTLGNIYFPTKQYILLAAFLISALLPYIIKKNIAISLSIAVLIAIGVCVYESAYLIWAVPGLCVNYAYRISLDESKSLRHKTRLHIFELLIVGFFAVAIPIIVKIKQFTPATNYIVKSNLPIVLIYIVLFAISFHTAFFRKAQHKSKQTGKLLAAVYITSAICCLTESVFYTLIPYFLYCDYKFIFLPWVISICFIAINDDPNVKFIVDKVDLAFDKFSKIDLEKK